MPEERFEGSVKWFSLAKGYGFITNVSDGGEDVYVHYSNITKCPSKRRTLLDGSRVEFHITDDEKGRRNAKNVSGVGGTFVTPAKRHNQSKRKEAKSKETEDSTTSSVKAVGEAGFSCIITAKDVDTLVGEDKFQKLVTTRSDTSSSVHSDGQPAQNDTPTESGWEPVSDGDDSSRSSQDSLWERYPPTTSEKSTINLESRWDFCRPKRTCILSKYKNPAPSVAAAAHRKRFELDRVFDPVYIRGVSRYQPGADRLHHHLKRMNLSQPRSYGRVR